MTSLSETEYNEYVNLKNNKLKKENIHNTNNINNMNDDNNIISCTSLRDHYLKNPKYKYFVQSYENY